MTILFIFILGTLVGSFLNCLIYRLEMEESFIKGRSYCPHCKKALQAKDLVPIISFALLRGRCRYCREKISLHYPLVELFVGLLFVLVFLSYGISIETLYHFIIFSLMTVVFIFDFKHYIIPDEITFSAIGVVSLWRIIQGASLLNFLLSGLGAATFFLSIYLFSKGEWMGFGDVKLALFMGLYLGYPNILVALFSSFLLGAIIGSVVVLIESKSIRSEIPFGPFLIAGTMIALLFGELIIKWYVY